MPWARDWGEESASFTHSSVPRAIFHAHSRPPWHQNITQNLYFMYRKWNVFFPFNISTSGVGGESGSVIFILMPFEIIAVWGAKLFANSINNNKNYFFFRFHLSCCWLVIAQWIIYYSIKLWKIVENAFSMFNEISAPRLFALYFFPLFFLETICAARRNGEWIWI